MLRNLFILSIFIASSAAAQHKVVADKIVVELKAITRLDEVHLSQALNYLEAYSPETGLLINFGSKSLEFRRVSNEYRLKRQQNASWLIQILL